MTWGKFLCRLGFHAWVATGPKAPLLHITGFSCTRKGCKAWTAKVVG